MVWYSHLFQNFPQVAVIHTVIGFGIVNKAVDVSVELSCFFSDPMLFRQIIFKLQFYQCTSVLPLQNGCKDNNFLIDRRQNIQTLIIVTVLISQDS